MKCRKMLGCCRNITYTASVSIPTKTLQNAAIYIHSHVKFTCVMQVIVFAVIIVEFQYTKSTFSVGERNGTFLSAISITYHHDQTIMVQRFHAEVCIIIIPYIARKIKFCLDHSNITSANKVFSTSILCLTTWTLLLGLYLTNGTR